MLAVQVILVKQFVQEVLINTLKQKKKEKKIIVLVLCIFGWFISLN